MATNVDVIVIGLGPGGEAAAGQLAEEGLNVVGIEGALVGGECPHWGCIPSKMTIRAANLLAQGRRVDELSGRATVEPDWGLVAERIRDQATDNWDDTVAVDRFVGKGGHFVRGYAQITAPRTVEVNGDTADEPDAADLLAQREEVSRLFAEAGELLSEPDENRMNDYAKRVLALTAGLEEKILVLLRSEEPGYKVVPRAIYFRYLKRIATNLLGVVSTATEPLPNIDYLDDGATDVTDD